MTKVLVIGLDGVPLDLVKSWAAEGKLPTLARVMDRGVVAPVNSTIPHTSGPAWSSFMSGKNPGKTGIYDFLYRRKDSYVFYPNNAKRRDGKSIWEILSDAGKRVGVLNVPMTYPVEPVNGFIISGFMTPYTARDFAYPLRLLAELEEKVGRYQIYPLATFAEKHKQAYFDACHRLLDMRTKVALHLMQREAWDFFMAVFFDTDRIQHQLWHYIDPDHSWRNADRDVDKSEPVWRYFQHLDASIGQLIEQAGKDALVMIMSDHGMGSAHKMIVLNTWLLNNGFLQLKGNPLSKLKHALFGWGFTLRNVHQAVDKMGLAKHAEYKVMYSADALLKAIFLSFQDVDWSRSRAYSFGRSVGPIFLNLKGREPQGIVNPGREYEQLRDEIAAMAGELTDPDTGQKLVGQVLYREEVYNGPYVEQAPDLMLLPRDPANKFYGLADFGSNQVVQPMYRYSGMHRQYGMVMMAGPQIERGTKINEPNIVDLAPTILYALAVPIPVDMDGRPLLEVFAHDQKHDAPLAAEAPHSATPASEESSYTPEEARQVESRLRELGYLG